MRLEACGVCHTDMYTASGADPSGRYRLGQARVSLVREGDRVVTAHRAQRGGVRALPHGPGPTCARPPAWPGRAETLDTVPTAAVRLSRRRRAPSGSVG
ncbi:MAG: hypothetical protein WKF40_07625 [Thermoleophilaceae bacterium]